jgi:hypothetical protein
MKDFSIKSPKEIISFSSFIFPLGKLHGRGGERLILMDGARW